jgi:hypothetical protein
MDEQNERAMEERADAELAQSFMVRECESMSEDDGSCSFEDLEDPQLGSTSGDHSDSRSASPTNIYRKNYRRPWTPDTVASELPILPKVLNLYLSPKRDQLDVRSDDSSSSGARANCKQNWSASMQDSFLPIQDDSDAITSSLYSGSWRRTLDDHSHEKIIAGLVSTSKSPVPRSASFSTENTSIHGLADIDETKATSPTRHQKMNEKHWTPDSVAYELNQYMSPKTSRSRDQDETSAPRARANYKRNRSASMPSPDLLNSSDKSTSSTSSRSCIVESRSPQNIRSTSSSPVPRSNSLQADDNSIHGLANIEETDVFSGYETPKKSVTNSAVFENEDGIRRRCHTDPTDSGERCYASAPFSAGAEDNPRPTVFSPPPRNKHKSPAFTPSKNGLLRTRHSTDSLGGLQTPQQQSSPRNESVTKLLELGKDEVHSFPSRSASLTFPPREEHPRQVLRQLSSSSVQLSPSNIRSGTYGLQQEEQPSYVRPRSSSNTFQLPPSTHNFELNTRNRRNGPQREEQPSHDRTRSNSMPLMDHSELNARNRRNDSREGNGTDGPSREWFWIWA